MTCRLRTTEDLSQAGESIRWGKKRASFHWGELPGGLTGRWLGSNGPGQSLPFRPTPDSSHRHNHTRGRRVQGLRDAPGPLRVLGPCRHGQRARQVARHGSHRRREPGRCGQHPEARRSTPWPGPAESRPCARLRFGGSAFRLQLFTRRFQPRRRLRVQLRISEAQAFEIPGDDVRDRHAHEVLAVGWDRVPGRPRP